MGVYLLFLCVWITNGELGFVSMFFFTHYLIIIINLVKLWQDESTLWEGQDCCHIVLFFRGIMFEF
jgi:hypothetical protein